MNRHVEEEIEILCLTLKEAGCTEDKIKKVERVVKFIIGE